MVLAPSFSRFSRNLVDVHGHDLDYPDAAEISNPALEGLLFALATVEKGDEGLTLFLALAVARRCNLSHCRTHHGRKKQNYVAFADDLFATFYS